jgi:uncharacterized membrane protein YeaQ/YmgE (transglycosylase-associated protein family)
MHALPWFIDGLVAGWLTGKMMAGEGRDLVMDLVTGAAGAIAGGFIMSTLGSLVHGRMIFTDMAAMAGGVALTAVYRLLARRQVRETRFLWLRRS